MSGVVLGAGFVISQLINELGIIRTVGSALTETLTDPAANAQGAQLGRRQCR